MQAAGDPQAQPLNLAYEQQVRLCNPLQRLQEMAAAQPRNWVRYCATTSGERDGTLGMLPRRSSP